MTDTRMREKETSGHGHGLCKDPDVGESTKGSMVPCTWWEHRASRKWARHESRGMSKTDIGQAREFEFYPESRGGSQQF